MDEMLKSIDETIISVCTNVKGENTCFKGYADTVKALALLVDARAKLGINQ